MQTSNYMNDFHFIGASFIFLITLLGGYLIIIKIRENFREYPDPKMTYATIEEVNKLQDNIKETQKDFKKDFIQIEQTLRKGLENTATLIAQSQIYNQRLNELNLKIDTFQNISRK